MPESQTNGLFANPSSWPSSTKSNSLPGVLQLDGFQTPTSSVHGRIHHCTRWKTTISTPLFVWLRRASCSINYLNWIFVLHNELTINGAQSTFRVSQSHAHFVPKCSARPSFEFKQIKIPHYILSSMRKKIKNIKTRFSNMQQIKKCRSNMRLVLIKLGVTKKLLLQFSCVIIWDNIGLEIPLKRWKWTVTKFLRNILQHI